LKPANNKKEKEKEAEKIGERRVTCPAQQLGPVTSPTSPYRFEKNRGGGVIIFLRSLKQLSVASTAVARARIRAVALYGL
jgi:hypothetical protein